MIGIVEDGKVKLPHETRLPDGMRVLVVWDVFLPTDTPPLEREPWPEEEVRKEIERAQNSDEVTVVRSCFLTMDAEP